MQEARPRGRIARSTWTPVWGSTWRRMAGEGPTGIVGPSESIGAVTQMRYRLTQFIDAIFLRFSRVGLCHVLCFNVQVTWRPFGRLMRSER